MRQVTAKIVLWSAIFFLIAVGMCGNARAEEVPFGADPYTDVLPRSTHPQQCYLEQITWVPQSGESISQLYMLAGDYENYFPLKSVPGSTENSWFDIFSAINDGHDDVDLIYAGEPYLVLDTPGFRAYLIRRDSLTTPADNGPNLSKKVLIAENDVLRARVYELEEELDDTVEMAFTVNALRNGQITDLRIANDDLRKELRRRGELIADLEKQVSDLKAETVVTKTEGGGGLSLSALLPLYLIATAFLFTVGILAMEHRKRRRLERTLVRMITHEDGMAQAKGLRSDFHERPLEELPEHEERELGEEDVAVAPI